MGPEAAFMTRYERNFRRIEPTARRIVAATLAMKTVVVRGRENFVREGPTIIVGNHCGSFHDVCTLFRAVPRYIQFSANRMIFDRASLDFIVRRHLKRHLGGFGLVLNALVLPLRRTAGSFISDNAARIGAIPVDMYSQDGKREAIATFQAFLREGCALVSLQGRGRVMPSDPNPYVRPFGRGVAIVACGLQAEHGLAVPVTPVAIYGAQRPWILPGRILVNAGPPLFARDHLDGDFEASVLRFKAALEKAVQGLFFDLIRS
jgi:1-acyl-sn-glycerol-3-phosphate acyltransferase